MDGDCMYCLNNSIYCKLPPKFTMSGELKYKHMGLF